MEDFNQLGKLKTFFLLKEADPFFIIKWCMDRKLIASESLCPVCNDTMVLAPCADLQDKANWSCHVRSNNDVHHVKQSIREGSWFNESDLDIPDILLMTFMWATKLPVSFITEQLRINQSIVEDWGMLCRILCLKALAMNSQRLGGTGTIVEVQANRLREFRYKNGKLLEGQWVIWGFQRGTCNCFYSIVKEVNPESFFSVLQKYVLPETKVVSRCWKACGGTKILISFYKKVNDRLKLEDLCPLSDKRRNDESLIFGYKIFLRSLDRIWGATYKSLPDPYCKKEDFDFFLAEYVWRKKYKKSAEGMESLLAAVTASYPNRQVVAEEKIPEEITIKMEFDILDKISEEMTMRAEMPEGIVIKTEHDLDGAEIELEKQMSDETETYEEEKMPGNIRINMEFDIEDESEGLVINETELYEKDQIPEGMIIKTEHDVEGTKIQLEQMLEETETILEKHMPQKMTIKVEPEE